MLLNMTLALLWPEVLLFLCCVAFNFSFSAGDDEDIPHSFVLLFVFYVLHIHRSTFLLNKQTLKCAIVFAAAAAAASAT